MVAQAARVDGSGFEGVSQGKHRQQRGHAGLVAEVIFELAARQLRAGAGFRRDETRFPAILDVMAHKGIGNAGEVGSAAETGDDDIRILSGQFHLLLGLQADHGLVQADVVQHRSQCILAVGRGDGQLDGLGDGAAQRALVVRVDGQQVFAGPRGHGGRSGNGRPEGLHDAPAVRFLLIADLHHINGAVNAELLGCIRKGTAPLPCTRLRRNIGNTLFFSIIGLGQRRIELVRTGGAYAFVLEIDVRRGAERCFQLISTHQRCAAVGGILLPYLLRNGDPLIRLVQLLVRAGLAEDGIKIFRLERLTRGGMQERKRLVGHHSLNVEIMGGNLGFRQQVLFLFHNE